MTLGEIQEILNESKLNQLQYLKKVFIFNNNKNYIFK